MCTGKQVGKHSFLWDGNASSRVNCVIIHHYSHKMVVPLPTRPTQTASLEPHLAPPRVYALKARDHAPITFQMEPALTEPPRANGQGAGPGRGWRGERSRGYTLASLMNWTKQVPRSHRKEHRLACKCSSLEVPDVDRELDCPSRPLALDYVVLSPVPIVRKPN